MLCAKSANGSVVLEKILKKKFWCIFTIFLLHVAQLNKGVAYHMKKLKYPYWQTNKQTDKETGNQVMQASSHRQLLYLRYKNKTVTMVWSYEMIVFDIVHKLTAVIVQLSDITVGSK